MLDTSINVKTDHFDGPLSLLFLLIQRQEMDIKKLDLTEITQQYLTYLSKMKDLDFDVAGDYLYLAATLLLLKSKDCMTEEDVKNLGEEFQADQNLKITSHAELVRRLEELRHFQKMSEKLWALPKKGHEVFTRPKISRKSIVNSILLPMDLEKLTLAMMDFIQKEKRKYTVVRRDRLSIKEKLVFLKNYLKVGQMTDFEHLVDVSGEREVDNIVITFISLLELARFKKIDIYQNDNSPKIFVEVVEQMEDLDIESADGFEPEDEADEISPEIIGKMSENVSTETLQ